jgi:purine-binding chemotaxis protein CheW
MDEQLVLFELKGELYGINVAHVQSIISKQDIVTVPGASSFIEGVINLRGSVVPVVDLRARFKLSAATTTQKFVIVIVELDGLQIGLIVDKVTEVARISETAIEPPSPLLTSVDTAYLRGIGKFHHTGNDDVSLVILLDLARIFSFDEQQALVEAH